MNLKDIIGRDPSPAPWAEGEKIPWHEPEFSRRMLREHLSQAHDMASRRSGIIDQQVAWLHQEILQGKPGHVLDLGCGPGFYSQRLAEMGHTVTGIDFSPASIGYAQEHPHPRVSYVLGDVRTTDFGAGYHLAMMLFGEFNVFKPAEARRILEKAYAGLQPGGMLLLEAHTFDYVRELGQAPRSWYSARQGVFVDGAFICLSENFWHPEPKVWVERFYVLEAESGAVTRFTQSMQAYTDSDYLALVAGVGFQAVTFYPSLGADWNGAGGFLVVVGWKGEEQGIEENG